MNYMGYPGNGERPSIGTNCKITVRQRSYPHEKRTGMATWSGIKWVTMPTFRIGNGKVIKWEVAL